MSGKSDLRKFGDEDYGAYGFGWCNPAFSNQEPITNEQYLATIPDDHPWKPILLRGAERLDTEYPGWRVIQVKSKFNDCRFYADPGDDVGPKDGMNRFYRMLSQIERECDAS